MSRKNRGQKKNRSNRGWKRAQISKSKAGRRAHQLRQQRRNEKNT